MMYVAPEHQIETADVATVVPALIGPAVHNAIGRWTDGFPITPDKVLKALGKA